MYEEVEVSAVNPVSHPEEPVYEVALEANPAYVTTHKHAGPHIYSRYECTHKSFYTPELVHANRLSSFYRWTVIQNSPIIVS